MTRGAPILRECLAEFIGTLILVFFGVGAVNAAVLAGVTQGLWQVAAIWAIAVALAIYATGAVSGAHINPAITMALAVWRGFPKRKIAPYVVAQVAGAFAGSLLYGLFHGLLTHFEVSHHLVRGGPGSELSAMVFGEYFPNPAMLGTTAEAYQQVPVITAFLAEAIGTAFLAVFVFALTSSRNSAGPRVGVPVFIGLALAVIIMIVAPLTQAGLNPARDFGPRLLAYLLGWGQVAIPGPRGGFFAVYILAPVLGAVFGAGVYEWLGRALVAPAARVEPVTVPPPPLARSNEVESGAYVNPNAPERLIMTPVEPAIILVPCADSGSAGCTIVRRAAELVAASTSVAEVREVEECSRLGKSYVVAIDASNSCQASGALRDYCCRPGAVVSAPAVLGKAGLVKPGVDVRARAEELAQALAATIRDYLHAVIVEVEERKRYREEIGPIMSRFQGIWEKLEAMASPNGAADHAEGQKVELLGRRARNLFVKFDEFIPPAEWSEPHDLFQDALLCIAYATEGWAAGDAERWEQNLEKARAQITPLRRRLEG